MKAKILSNSFRPVTQLIEHAAQTHTELAAASLAAHVRAALDEYGAELHSDTHALAESLYVRSTGRNDYEAALERARAAFISNPSRYRKSPASPATQAEFERIIAAQEALPDRGQAVFVTTVVTALAYGLHWETGSDERPWMEPAALRWASEEAARVYEGLKLN